MKEKKSWCKTRHRVITALLRPVLGLYTRWKYGVDIPPFAAENGRQYLVVMNHQTAFDQFFLSLAFRQPIYFLASEDLFSMGWLSRLLEWAVAPIPIKKQTTDLRAMRTCVKVAREGGTIALAPEGNRTYSGRTGYFNPAIIKMIRMLRLPLAIFRIEGGYGVHPRWSDVVRRGRMRACVTRVVEPEEYLSLSPEELHSLLTQALWVDEANDHGPFRHRRCAEYLERAIYVCPHCGLSDFVSRGEVITCQRCGLAVRYLPSTRLQGISGEFPFPFVAQWYDYQCQFVRGLDLSAYTDAPLHTDQIELRKVLVYQKKQRLHRSATLHLYGDRLEVRSGAQILCRFPFDQTGMITVLGKNKLNIYFEDQLYQVRGSKRFNALRYVNIYHHYRHISKGDTNGEFLGL